MVDLFSETLQDRPSSGGLGGFGGSGENTQDVALLHDQQHLAVDLDLAARPRAEKHAVTGADLRLDQLATLIARAGAD